MKLINLSSWMELFSSEERSYKEDGLTVYVYGEKDNSYVVLERDVSKTPKTVDQYTIHPLNNENSLFSFICFLKECEFDLEVLILKISSANYTKEDMNEVCLFENVEIAKYQIKEN